MDLDVKLRFLERLTDELDERVWEIFHRYIAMEHINFNRPESWRPDGSNGIVFSRQDGCRGCYDPKEICIPRLFFTDPEEAFTKRQEERRAEFEEQQQRAHEQERQAELRELARLQLKYTEQSNQ